LGFGPCGFESRPRHDKPDEEVTVAKIIFGGIAIGWGVSTLYFNLFVRSPQAETTGQQAGLVAAYILMVLVALAGWALLKAGIEERRRKVAEKIARRRRSDDS
jgi:hypothetical protein